MRATFFGVARRSAHEADVVLAEDRPGGHHFDHDERQEYARAPSEAILDPVLGLAEDLFHLQPSLLLHLSEEALMDRLSRMDPSSGKLPEAVVAISRLAHPLHEESIPRRRHHDRFDEAGGCGRIACHRQKLG